MSKHVFTALKVVQAGSVKNARVTCTGGFHGAENETGKPIIIDNWASEVHSLVRERDGGEFLGNVGGAALAAPPAGTPHYPLL